VHIVEFSTGRGHHSRDRQNLSCRSHQQVCKTKGHLTMYGSKVYLRSYIAAFANP